MTLRAALLNATRPAWAVHYVTLSLCAGLSGCVAQSTYDEQAARTADFRESLAQAHTEAAELMKQIEALHASNRELDATTDELRTAIQREEEANTVLRHRAQDKLAALQAQVTHLVNQSRALGRDLADAKQHNASLRASLARYKRELEAQQERAEQAVTMPGTVSGPDVAMAPSPIQPPPSVAPAAPPPVTQAPPPAPVQPGTAIPQEPQPAAPDDSWMGWLIGWLSGLWSWIFD